jgi:hypothetical protein
MDGRALLQIKARERSCDQLIREGVDRVSCGTGAGHRDRSE